MYPRLFLASLLASATLAAGAMTFDESVSYGKLAIQSRLSDFYANTKQTGFDVYDAQGTKVKSSANASNLRLDYVPASWPRLY